MLRVALAGHSQLPYDPDIAGTEISIFRAPGGKAYLFCEDGRLSDVLNWSRDMVIVWLDSNDTEENTSVSEGADNIINIKESMDEECRASLLL